LRTHVCLFQIGRAPITFIRFLHQAIKPIILGLRAPVMGGHESGLYLLNLRNHHSPTCAVIPVTIPPIPYHLFTAVPDNLKNLKQQESAMQLPPDLAIPRSPPNRPAPRENPLMTQAKALEASFLSEMLGYAGVGKPLESFGGGIGEEQFGSFLRDAQAKQMVENGGIGLAEQLFRAMTKGQTNAG